MAMLINEAQANEDIKVIFVHGGLFYGAGNELKILASMGGMDREDMIANASKGVEHQMIQCLMACHRSKKPIVALVRGMAIGISFTTLAHFDFIYCTPETRFFVPFMNSF